MKKQLPVALILASVSVLGLIACNEKPKFKPGYSDVERYDAEAEKKKATEAKATKDREALKAEVAAELNTKYAELKSAQEKLETLSTKASSATSEEEKKRNEQAMNELNEDLKNKDLQIKSLQAKVEVLEKMQVTSPTRQQPDALPTLPQSQEKEGLKNQAKSEVKAETKSETKAEEESEVEVTTIESQEKSSKLENPSGTTSLLKLQSGNQAENVIVDCVKSGSSHEGIAFSSGTRFMMSASNDKNEDSLLEGSCAADSKAKAQSVTDDSQASRTVNLKLGQSQSVAALVAVKENKEKEELKRVLMNIEVSCLQDFSSVAKTLRGIVFTAGGQLHLNVKDNDSAEGLSTLILNCK